MSTSVCMSATCRGCGLFNIVTVSFILVFLNDLYNSKIPGILFSNSYFNVSLSLLPLGYTCTCRLAGYTCTCRLVGYTCTCTCTCRLAGCTCTCILTINVITKALHVQRTLHVEYTLA